MNLRLKASLFYRVRNMRNFCGRQNLLDLRPNIITYARKQESALAEEDWCLMNGEFVY